MNIPGFAGMESYFNSLGTAGLALNSFVESFFLVPPPDFMLIAMDLAKPERALFYATICTFASALGGLVGWLIGRFGGRPAFNWCVGMFSKNKEKVHAQFDKIEHLYNENGIMALFLGSFTPVPYKLFTIGSGVLNMNPLHFFVISIFGRGARFFLVSVVLMFFGEQIKEHLTVVILAATAVIILFFIVLYKKRHSFTKSRK